MLTNTQHNLENHYQLFSRDHDRLKADLMAQLPEVQFQSAASQVSSKDRSYWNRVVRRGLAAGLLFALVTTGIMMNQNPNGTPSLTSAVWANPIEIIRQVSSVHFIFSTPGQSSTHASNASVEVWWQKDGRYRMEYSNGLIFTFDGSRTYIKSPEGGLRVLDYNGPGPHSFILSVLGEIGGQDQRFNAMPGMTDQANKLTSQEIEFNGLECLQVNSDTGSYLYRYIMDRHLPIVYQVAMYRSNTKNPIALAKVLDIDGHLDDSQFVIEPTAVQNH